jgi:DNA-binding NtrC family response regulator
MKEQVTVLLVDDNQKFTDRMTCMLIELGIDEIKVAGDYEEAKKILITKVPEVALLDIHLPGKNGIELLKFIRRLDENCCVIMVSNQADPYYQRLCLKLGANHFIDKTIDLLRIPDLILNLKNP